jgi:hypothetical protein
MQAEATTELGQIEAGLNYLVPSAEAPYVYAYDPPPGIPARAGTYEERIVPINDARPLLRELSLDRQGFILRRHQTRTVDFYDADEVARLYYPEIVEMVTEATGAAKVVIFDHTIRNADPAVQSGRQAHEPVTRVHNDYTEKSGPQRVRDLLDPAEAEARLQRRFVEINVWRPIAGPVESWPLALCDARSVDARDLVAAERRYPDRIGEIYMMTYNPRHRWFYFPRMERDEAVFIKCFDSATDGRARLSAHTSFVDPTTRPGAPPRESIEVRTLAFF